MTHFDRPVRNANTWRLGARAALLLLLCAACGDAEDDPESDVNAITADGGKPDASITVSPEAGQIYTPPSPQGDGSVTTADASADGSAPINTQDEGGTGNPNPNIPPMGNCPAAPTGKAGSTADLTLNGRNYTLHIGSSVKPNQPAPLVFSLHGLTMSPRSMEAMAGWDPVADKEGLIIARPAGVGSQNGWDLTGTKDFDLMKAIIEDVNAKACVDRKRIYATGFSHGGFMSFAIACRLGDIFAAVGPNAGSGSVSGSCTKRAVPVYAFHGNPDSVVSFASGERAVNAWVSHNQCTGTPSTFMVGNASCKDWNMCSAGGQVKFCSVPGIDHSYMRAATAALWEFFKAHPLP